MADKKLTDNEIIKALECCILGDCQGCFYGDTDQRHCKDDLMQNALNLINRQDQENEDLSYKLIGVMHSVDKWLDGEELNQDEVSRAATMREKTLQIIEKQTAENKSLKAEVERLKETIEVLRPVVEQSHIIRKGGKSPLSLIKAEAYKEFAERLKAKMVKHNFKYADTLFNAIVATVPMVDNLLNELVGGNNV